MIKLNKQVKVNQCEQDAYNQKHREISGKLIKDGNKFYGFMAQRL